MARSLGGRGKIPESDEGEGGVVAEQRERPQQKRPKDHHGRYWVRFGRHRGQGQGSGGLYGGRPVLEHAARTRAAEEGP